jgi:hypothetical protein
MRPDARGRKPGERIPQGRDTLEVVEVEEPGFVSSCGADGAIPVGASSVRSPG